MVLLSSLSAGTEGRIEAIRGEGALVERIRELGFVEGEKVSVAQTLWGGGSHIVYIQNASVALRKDEADCIEVEAIRIEVTETPPA